MRSQIEHGQKKALLAPIKALFSCMNFVSRRQHWNWKKSRSFANRKMKFLVMALFFIAGVLGAPTGDDYDDGYDYDDDR